MADLFDITALERRDDPAVETPMLAFGGTTYRRPARSGWFAEIRVDDERLGYPVGARLQLSLLDGEETWAVDAIFTGNGAPIFVNGFGSRMLRIAVASPMVAATLGRMVSHRTEDAAVAMPPCDCAASVHCDDCGAEIPSADRAQHEAGGHAITPYACEECEPLLREVVG